MFLHFKRDFTIGFHFIKGAAKVRPTRLTLGNLKCVVQRVTLLGQEREYSFEQQSERIFVSGLPEQAPDNVCPVLRFECNRPPVMYLRGGMRTPNVSHPHYDPCPSDLAH